MTKAPYLDEDITHDRSYYGKGCSNGWGTDGEGGSQTPCADSDAGGRYIKTADNETQKNGTLYDFQAATSGAGAALTASNTDSLDTFCPLGWQLPYSGTGGDYYNKSRSWNYLFTAYNIESNPGSTADATKVASYPFSYVYSGYYYWNKGRLYRQTSTGYYWSSTNGSGVSVFLMSTWSGEVRRANVDSKLRGQAFRCSLILAKLKSNNNPKLAEADFGIRAFHFVKAHFTSVKIMSNYLENETKYFIF